MPCSELERLREQIRSLNTQMKEARGKAASSHDRREDTRHKHGANSMELLKRRADRAKAAIEQHIATHHCTD